MFIVYFFCLHVSGDYVPIIRRNNCIYATLGTCYSVWMTVCYACISKHTRQSFTRLRRDARSAKHKKKYEYILYINYQLDALIIIYS